MSDTSEPSEPDEPGDADETEAPLTPPPLIAWSSASLPTPVEPDPTPTEPALPEPAPTTPSTPAPATPPPGGPPPSTPATETSPVRTAPAPRKRWIVVLVAVLGATVLIAAAGTVLFFTNTWPPLHATYQFVDDLDDGDLDAAYAQVCDAQRGDSADRDSFDRFADILLDDLDNFSVNVLAVDRDGDEATVEITAVKRNQSNVLVELRLVNEDNDWRPCGVN